MAEYKIPAADWPDALAAALLKAADGDAVIVGTEPMRLLAESAAGRMGKAGVTVLVSPYAQEVAQ